jgi:DNA repair protein RadC
MRIRELHTTYRTRDVNVDGIIGRHISSPSTAAHVAAALPISTGRLEDCHVEHFGILALNAKHRVIAFKVISIGTLDATVVHPRDVFRAAIDANAAAIVVFHNHPSGDPEPSPEDRRLTDRLTAAGALMGIDVLDHVVIGHDARYCSFRERGTL